jgi:hypothetical protein
MPRKPSIRKNLTTIMRPAIDKLIRDEMRDEVSDDSMINPKIIQMLKHSVNLDLSRSNEKIYDRLYKEKALRDK